MKKQKIATSTSSVPEGQQLKNILIELGSQLREHRQEQGLSLDYISTKTRIRQRLLIAIEEGKLEQLPEPVYIHYFLRRYAELLGLDGQTFASPFPSESRFKLLSSSLIRWPMLQLQPIHLYLLYIAIIFGSVNGLSSFIERSMGTSAGYVVEQPQPASEAIATASASVTSPAPNPPALPTSNPSPPTNNQPENNLSEAVRVDIVVSETSWVRVEADGETTFEGLLTKGTQQTWVANQKLIILTGNAGGVSVALNKGEAEQLGEPGAVEEVIFTASQLSRS